MNAVDIFAALSVDRNHSGADEIKPDLDDTLQALVDNLRLIVPSYLGFSVKLRENGIPVTLTTLEDHHTKQDVHTSLRLPLTALADVEVGSMLDVYGGESGAFVDFAADLCRALNLRSDQVELDRHLIPPAEESVLSGAGDVSVVNQAVGILITHGHTGADARIELRRRARHHRTSMSRVARQLIQATVHDPRARR